MEVRKLLLDLQYDISNFPLKIIQELMAHNMSEEFPSGANVHLIEKDENVTITAVVNTTLGEVFFSNPCKLKDVIKDEQHMKQNAFG